MSVTDLIITAPASWDGVESLDGYLAGPWDTMAGHWECLAPWGTCAVVMEDACTERGLRGVPWRFALGCLDGLADPEGIGWVMVNELIWVHDDGHTPVFVLARSSEWYGDAYAVTTPYRGRPRRNLAGRQRGAIQPHQRGQRLSVEPQVEVAVEGANGLGRTLGDVLRGDGSELLAQLRAIFTPEICTKCGTPRRRTLGRRCLGCGSTIPRQKRACPRCECRERSRHVVGGRVCLCGDDSAPTRPGRVEVDAALYEHDEETETETVRAPAPGRLFIV